MGNFFAELKRRQVYRVAAAYVVVAWVLLQIVNNIAPVLDLPVWVSRTSLFFLALGFPIAVFFAWMRELPSDAVTAPRATVADWSLIGVLIVVIALVSYQQFTRIQAPGVQKAGIEAGRESSALPAGAISIAVLPFENLSGDVAQEFFSDGITEEITSALAKIPDLRVVARTSAFQFKAQNRDIQSIGQQLHASHFIEGSVRKAGNRVRITAQLIEVNNGVHIWAESFDRELTDIFAVQEDIATAIAAALRVPLGLKPGEHLVSNRSVAVDSYQQYLHAKALVRARGLTRVTDAAALLEQVVANDPDFAPAWALLAQAYHFTPTYHPARDSSSVEEYRRVVDASLPKAEAAARRAIELDANLADGYLALGYVQAVRGKWLMAEDLYAKALGLDANNPDAQHLSSLLLTEVGLVKDALPIRQRLQAQEPLVPVFNAITGLVLWLNGRNDDAIATLKALPPGARGEGPLAMIYAEAGRYSDAADLLQRIPPDGPFLTGTVEDAVRLLRTAPAKATSPQMLPRLGALAWVFLSIGAPERALEFYEGNAEAGFLLGGIIAPLWHASYASVRKTERFKAYVRASQMLEYWRAKGWPEFCRPTTGDDFACE